MVGPWLPQKCIQNILKNDGIANFIHWLQSHPILKHYMVAEKFVVLISRQDDQADVTSHGQFNSSAMM